MSGEKTMVFDQDLETKILAKQSVEQAIKQGLTKNMLFVAYQPIIDNIFVSALLTKPSIFAICILEAG